MDDDLLLEVILVCSTFCMDEACAAMLTEAELPSLLITLLKGRCRLRWVQGDVGVRLCRLRWCTLTWCILRCVHAEVVQAEVVQAEVGAC